MEEWTKFVSFFPEAIDFLTGRDFEISKLSEVSGLLWLKYSAYLLSFFTAFLAFYMRLRSVMRRKMLEILVDPIAFWNKKPSRKRIKKYRTQMTGSIPIIAIADFKGGTGKSMIATNLAACLDQHEAKVLVLDLGHNTTLSQMLPMDEKAKGFAWSAHHILKGKGVYYPPEKLTGSFQNSYLYPAMDDLRKDDARLAFRRLIGSQKGDIRFHVHDYLSTEAIQKRFDMVIIDMPARLSTTAANALCACTHVLVPTVLDPATQPATIETLKTLRNYRKALKLKFRFLGVVPSMVQSQAGLGRHEIPARQSLADEMERQFATLRVPGTSTKETIDLWDRHIMNKVGLRHRAQQNLPYFTINDAVIRAMFDNMRRRIEDDLLPQGFDLAYLEKEAARVSLVANERQEAAVASSLAPLPAPMTAPASEHPSGPNQPAVAVQPERTAASAAAKPMAPTDPSTIQHEIEAVRQAMLEKAS